MQERVSRKKSLSPLPVLRVTMTFIKSLPSLPIATTCNRGYYYLYFINEKLTPREFKTLTKGHGALFARKQPSLCDSEIHEPDLWLYLQGTLAFTL